jgi:hypothetical protein
VLGVADTSGENLSYGATVGMVLVWSGVATVFALLRTTRRDIT